MTSEQIQQRIEEWLSKSRIDPADPTLAFWEIAYQLAVYNEIARRWDGTP